MNQIKKNSLVIILCLITTFSYAQISNASIQASGLTCSMCNLAIKKSLEKLPFIESVVPDLETATYELKFKKLALVNFNQIKEAVSKSGFSVNKLVFSIALQKPILGSNNQFEINGKSYKIIEGKIDSLKENLEFQIVDKGFISSKTYKKYKPKITAGSDLYHLIEIKGQ